MRKFTQIFLVVFALVGLISTANIIYERVIGSALSFEYVWEEFARIESPDKNFDAVIMRGSAGAMTSFREILYVVERGMMPVPENEMPHFSEGIQPDEVSWSSERELVLSMYPRKVFLYDPRPAVGGQKIRISLRMEEVSNQVDE